MELTLKILIVDDNAFNLFAIDQLINTLGYFSIDTAVNGLDSLHKIIALNDEDSYYDLILMDLNMPVMDGMKATQKLRKMQLKNEINLDRT